MFRTWTRIALILGLIVVPLVGQAADPGSHTQVLARMPGTGQHQLQTGKTRKTIRQSLRQAKDAPAAQPVTYSNLSIVNLEFVDQASCQAFEYPASK